MTQVISVILQVSHTLRLAQLPEVTVRDCFQVHANSLRGGQERLERVVGRGGVDGEPPGGVCTLNIDESQLLLGQHLVGGRVQVWDGRLQEHNVLEQAMLTCAEALG